MYKTQTNDNIYYRVIDTTAKLVCQKGYSGVSIKEIARQIEVDKSKLYDYFRSKDDVILSTVDYILEYCRQFVFSLSGNITTPEAIKVFYETLDDYFTKHHHHHVLMLLLALELNHREYSKIYRRINDYFTEWKMLFTHVLSPSLSDQSTEFINGAAKNCFAQLTGNLLLNYIDKKKGINSFPKSWEQLVNFCIQQAYTMKSLKQSQQDENIGDLIIVDPKSWTSKDR